MNVWSRKRKSKKKLKVSNGGAGEKENTDFPGLLAVCRW